jgi:hypothetical protein
VAAVEEAVEEAHRTFNLVQIPQYKLLRNQLILYLAPPVLYIPL